MRFRVLPYKTGSASARALANALGGLRLKTTGRSFRARSDDILINWGSSSRPERLTGLKLLNDPDTISRVSDKLTFFNRMAAWEETLIPKFWNDPDAIPEDAFPIVCRTVLNGHSGAGIVIANTRQEIVPAPLYVKYQKKDNEYRIHVGGEKIIAVQRKARSRAIENVNWQIRNHQNGFIFQRNGFEVPDRVIDAAKRSLAVSGLDFGAVDVIDRESKERALVLEINSAPGTTGQTIQDYVNYFKGEWLART